MHSFGKTIAIFIVAALATVVVSAQEGEIVEGFTQLSSRDGELFKDRGYIALSTLAEGPYSVTAATNAFPPVFAIGSGLLEKRQDCDCPSGYGCCGGGKCCPSGQYCSPATGGCCEANYPFTCGTQYCCPFSYCTPSGQCACKSLTETRCGDTCCLFGCNKDNTCACPAAFPVLCTDLKTCCPPGSTCVPGGGTFQCQKGSGTIPSYTNTSAPRPAPGGNGNDTAGQGKENTLPSAGNSLRCSWKVIGLLIAAIASSA